MSTRTLRGYRSICAKRASPRIHNERIIDGDDVEILDPLLTETGEDQFREMKSGTGPRKGCWCATFNDLLPEGYMMTLFPGPISLERSVLLEGFFSINGGGGSLC
jgi:hypothetical protein